MHKYIVRGFMAVCLVTVLVLQAAAPAYAATIRLYLNPASRTVTSGGGFSVQIRLSKDDNTFVKHIKARLTFPADKLMVSSISSQGSYFSTPEGSGATYNNSTGALSYEGGNNDSAGAGDHLVATVNFVAKNPGTAGVAFTGQSSATFTSNGENRLTGTAGGTYTVSSPPVVTPPPASSGSSPSPGSALTGVKKPTAVVPAPATPAPTAPEPSAPATPAEQPSGAEDEDTQGFTISDARITQVNSDSAVISWHTSSVATAAISYGTSSEDLSDTFKVSDSQSDFSVKLEKLPANKTIYFEIAAANGSEQAFYTSSFKTTKPSILSNLFLIIALLLGTILILAGVIYFLKKKRTEDTSKRLVYKLGKNEIPSPTQASAILAAVADSHSKKKENPEPPAEVEDPKLVAARQALVEKYSKPAPKPKQPAAAHHSAEPKEPHAAEKLEAPTEPAPATEPAPKAEPGPQPAVAGKSDPGRPVSKDNPSTHWPWVDGNQVAPRPDTAEPDYKNEPDIFELGEERMKEAEAAQAQKHLKQK